MPGEFISQVWQSSCAAARVRDRSSSGSETARFPPVRKDAAMRLFARGVRLLSHHEAVEGRGALIAGADLRQVALRHVALHPAVAAALAVVRAARAHDLVDASGRGLHAADRVVRCRAAGVACNWAEQADRAADGDQRREGVDIEVAAPRSDGGAVVALRHQGGRRERLG